MSPVDLPLDMKKALFTFFILIGFNGILLASGNLKTTKLQGTVTDKQGEPLAGVEVYIPSLKKSVYTDFDGNFSVESLPIQEQTLKVSFISYQEQEVDLRLDDLKSALHLELRSR